MRSRRPTWRSTVELVDDVGAIGPEAVVVPMKDRRLPAAGWHARRRAFRSPWAVRGSTACAAQEGRNRLPNRRGRSVPQLPPLSALGLPDHVARASSEPDADLTGPRGSHSRRRRPAFTCCTGHPTETAAFLVEPGDLIAIGKGVWMRHFFPVGSETTYAVLAARREPEQDADLVDFRQTSETVLGITLA